MGLTDFSLHKVEHADSRFTDTLLSEPGWLFCLEEQIIGKVELPLTVDNLRRHGELHGAVGCPIRTGISSQLHRWDTRPAKRGVKGFLVFNEHCNCFP